MRDTVDSSSKRRQSASGKELEHLGKAKLVDSLGGVAVFKGRQDPLIQLCGADVILLTPPGPSRAVERSPDLKIERGPVGNLEKGGLGFRPSSLIHVGARQERVSLDPDGIAQSEVGALQYVDRHRGIPPSRCNRPRRITASRA